MRMSAYLSGSMGMFGSNSRDLASSDTAALQRGQKKMKLV